MRQVLSLLKLMELMAGRAWQIACMILRQESLAFETLSMALLGACL